MLDNHHAVPYTDHLKKKSKRHIWRIESGSLKQVKLNWRTKMAFKLSKRSLSRLEGVDERMVRVVKTAITVSKIDFGVICGLRTIEEQRELVDPKGASQTMKSKHIDGLAVDLMAYIGGRASWELNLYDDIADAMKIAADEEDVSLRWVCLAYQ